MHAQSEVLIASADPQTCRTLASILSQWGLEPIFCSTVSKAKAILAQQVVPLVFCEDRLADGGFRDVVNATGLAKLKAWVAVISWTADGSGYLEAIQSSAGNNTMRCPYCLENVHRIILQAMSGDHSNRLVWEIT